MDGSVSPAALAANRRLYELRARLAAGRGEEATAAPAGAGEGAPAGRSAGAWLAAHRHAPPAAGRATTGPEEARQREIDSHSLYLIDAIAADESTLPSRSPTAVPAAFLAPAGARRPTTGPGGPTAGVGDPTTTSHSKSTYHLTQPPSTNPIARTTGYSLPAQQPGADGHPLADLAAALHRLPPHLGWGSETLTAHLRKIRDTKYEIRVPGAPGAGEQGSGGAGESGPWVVGSGQSSVDRSGCLSPAPQPDSSLVTRRSSLKVYPDLALGLLRAERAAAGRVWLLLRHLDAPGRGMVGLEAARAALTGKESPLRLCGRRRLRQLLAEGEGVFWAREQGRPAATGRDGGERLRLFGPARVAAALGVARLTGRPVAVPVTALLGPIGDARAHLYASFHTGRAKEGWRAGEQGSRGEREKGRKGAGEKEGKAAPPCASAPLLPCTSAPPISRATLTSLSGVCEGSQRAYERRAGVMARPNIALGERVASGAATVVGPAEQERAWQRGRALFRLKDYRGRYGRPGAVYLAWRLPNDYGAARVHTTQAKGQQKRINRQLTDLFTKGMTGNGAGTIGKRFYGTAVGAVKAAQGRGGAGGQERRPDEVHWPVGRARGGVGVWATVGWGNGDNRQTSAHGLRPAGNSARPEALSGGGLA